MTPKQVIKHFKTQANAARSLGVSRQAVSQWVSEKKIDFLRQCHIELVSAGKLKATR